ncbi:MAG: hypothetical protein HYW89_03290 [Candidatus Sungiibacteriota bacterium]|uniref:Uncharacterized protein n=1 Tax=Candidatus Sungiibacteriota bacterium TaxID=2750080 RepID=A0A7T5RJ09_9BACT|nr:MAG: hypothetical protein HYW89_03290 [Candidatus Sungbacteria bacterium]
MRKILVTLLLGIGVAFVLAPFGFAAGDKVFLSLFWWARDYMFTTALGGVACMVIGLGILIKE